MTCGVTVVINCSGAYSNCHIIILLSTTYGNSICHNGNYISHTKVTVSSATVKTSAVTKWFSISTMTITSVITNVAIPSATMAKNTCLVNIQVVTIQWHNICHNISWHTICHFPTVGTIWTQMCHNKVIL